MIPKIIWQTYKTKLPAQESATSIKTWLDLNPNHEWYYFDDDKCEKFIKDHFKEEFYQMYISLPFGVMKSDVWRIAIVYVYGGVYCDADTRCLQPIDTWTTDKELVVSIEPPTSNIGNFCFAAVPKHPALYLALEQLMQNYNSPNYLDKKEKTGIPIQNFGQHAFGISMKKYFDENHKNTDKLYSLEDNAFSPFISEKTLVFHEVGSIVWSGNYDSWRARQQHQFGY